MKNKIKYIGLGEYPSIELIKKCREQVTGNTADEKNELYIYFGTSKGIKKRKLF
jgi:hypothetical protein